MCCGISAKETCPCTRTNTRTLPSCSTAAAYKPMDAANVLWALGVLQRKPAPVAMQMLLAAVCDGPSPLSQQVRASLDMMRLRM
eukprot:1157472-Pelagomonas_calceolata.AAC.8